MTNATPFVPMINVLPDAAGIDTLFVVVRGTFGLAARGAPLRAALPPVAADVYWGAPGASSLKLASDVHVGKRGTDVIVVGQAHAPGGRPVEEMLTAVAIAGVKKVVRVVGDRVWQRGGAATIPRPFVTMPLVYERAFGGRGVDRAGGVVAEERNPVGVGFVGPGAAGGAAGRPLPNLEDPRHPLRDLGDRPPPAGYGPIAAAWQPRRRHAGTYDRSWMTSRAPLLPDDFDLRFDNVASDGLALDRFLAGGEPLALDGVSPEGPLRLALPTLRPRIAVHLAGRHEAPPAQLETVVVEPDERRLSLTWRAALRCDRSALKIQRIRITEEDPTCLAQSS